ncbi:unnamed protein product, partial [Rotaria socialis]
YCFIPRWVWFYITAMVVVFPAIISLVFNLLIFIRVYSSSKRIQPASQTAGTTDANAGTIKLSRRDRHLLQHSIIMFIVVMAGWCPTFLNIAIDYASVVSPVVYVVLQLWSIVGDMLIIIDLFIYNHELKKLIRDKFHNFHQMLAPTAQT